MAGATTRDTLGTLGGGSIPREMEKILTKLLNGGVPRVGANEIIASRATSSGGLPTVTRGGIRTPGTRTWLNDEVINFTGQALIQPNWGRGASRVHVYNSFLIGKLFSKRSTED